MTELFFDDDDLGGELLPPGFYPSAIARARLRTSAGGNRMIQVVHALEGVAPGHARLADYFVLEGALGTRSCAHAATARVAVPRRGSFTARR